MHPNLLALLMTSGKLTIRLHFIGVKMVRLTYGVAGSLSGRALVSSPRSRCKQTQLNLILLFYCLCHVQQLT